MNQAAIKQACQKHIEALLTAKSRYQTEDEFWKDGKSQKTYRRMMTTIEAEVVGKFAWWHSVWDLTGSTALSIWEGALEAGDVARFSDHVLAYLEMLQHQDWIASIPMERAFDKFPPITDFGCFHLVNPRGEHHEEVNVDELLADFRSILSTNFAVNFVQTTKSSESYLDIGDHFFRKSDGYIPGRPQMVLRVGVGDEFVNKHLLSALVRDRLAFLALCQIAYEQEDYWGSRMTNTWESRLPTGGRLQSGLIEIPGVAVGINTKNGRAAMWPIQTVIHETGCGLGYQPEQFLQLWNDIAEPIINLQNVAVTEKLRDALNNAVALVAKCRHPHMGDLALNAIIATETVLNPFGIRNCPSEAIALFAAKLLGDSKDRRIETYHQVKHLYNIRGQVVHQSSIPSDRGSRDTQKNAFSLFRQCLSKVVQWVVSETTAGRKCEQSDFQNFYTQTVLA